MSQPEWRAVAGAEYPDLPGCMSVVCTPPGTDTPETLAVCWSVYHWVAEDVAKLMALAPRMAEALRQIVEAGPVPDPFSPAAIPHLVRGMALAVELLALVPVIPDPPPKPEPKPKTRKKRGARLPKAEGE